MKIYSAPALAALEAGTAIVSGAVFVDLDPAFRVWGGHGVLALEGADFLGIGDRGLVATSGGTLGTAEQGAEMILSGVDPDTLALIDYPELRGAGVVMWELVFDASGSTLLAANVALRGSIDRVLREDVPGGSSRLRVMVEGAARGLGRRGVRMRSDADQRLYLGTDGGFRRVAYAGQKQLSLGGKPPVQAGSGVGAIGGGYGGGPGGAGDSNIISQLV